MSPTRYWHSRKPWQKTAIVGLVVWLFLLGWAFATYPELDNLVVGWPVFAFQGVDALGSLKGRPLKFAAVVVAETATVVMVCSGIGYLFQAYVASRRS